MKHRDIADDHIPAQVQADGFVGTSIIFIFIFSFKAFSPYHAVADDGNIMQVFAPYQAVVLMPVPKIFVLVAYIIFGKIIFRLVFDGSGDQYGASIKIKSDVGF